MNLIHIPHTDFVIIPPVEEPHTHIVFFMYHAKRNEPGQLIYSTTVAFTCPLCCDRLQKISGKLTSMWGTRIVQNVWTNAEQKAIVRRSNKQKFDTAMKIRYDRYKAAIEQFKSELKNSLFFDAEFATAVDNLNAFHEKEIQKLKDRYNQNS